MAPDTSPAEETAAPTRKRSADVVLRPGQVDTSGLDLLRSFGWSSGLDRMLADSVKLQSTALAELQLDMLEPVRRMANEMIRMQTSWLEGALDGVLPDIARSQRVWTEQLGLLDAGQALAPYRQAADTIARMQTSWAAPLAELTRQSSLPAISGIATGLERVFADAVRTAVGPQSSYWASMQADSFIRQIDFSSTTALQAKIAQLADVGELHVELTEQLTHRTPSELPELSASSVSHWRNYVLDLPTGISDDQAHIALVSGRTSLGMVAAEAVTKEDGERDLVVVEERILTPWQRGRQDVVDELYARLHSFDPTVPDLLDGAWDDVQRRGPAAVDKAATCMIEALDRTLRKAAPNDKLLMWFAQSGLDPKLWPDPAKQPSHALRIRYVLRATKDEAKLAVGMTESLLTMNTVLRSKVQSIKHTGQGDITAVRSLLMSTEHLLRMLFLT
ncbi:hypothetical protein [Kitasatospora sp. NPDC094015]|uniref:hypothetical protein n=1 Tax=Kitasatospora sp. NPDC094015 TaxID=3155205 RepID=UPI00331E33FA